MFARGDTPLFRSRDIPSILEGCHVICCPACRAVGSGVPGCSGETLSCPRTGQCPQWPSFAATQQASFTPPL